MQEKFTGGIVGVVAGFLLVLVGRVLAPTLRIGVNPETLLIALGFCGIIAGLSIILLGILESL